MPRYSDRAARRTSPRDWSARRCAHAGVVARSLRCARPPRPRTDPRITMNTARPIPADDETHRAAMQALQAEMDAKISAAKEKRGLVIVHTGDGKGKSTAAF